MKVTKCDECGYAGRSDRGWSLLTYHGDNGQGGPWEYTTDYCPLCTDKVFRAVPASEPDEEARSRKWVAR